MRFNCLLLANQIVNIFLIANQIVYIFLLANQIVYISLYKDDGKNNIRKLQDIEISNLF